MRPTKTPLLTIVTVTYKDYDGLASTLRSVSEQRGVSWEQVQCVIIDGEPSPNVAKITAELPAQHIYIGEKDQGVYDAMNKGTERANGEYVQYLNSGDAFSSPDALAKILSVLSARSPAWLIVGAFHLFGGQAPRALIGNIPHEWLKHAYGLQSHCHQATFFRTDVIRAMGGYSLYLGFVADFDLILRFGLVDSPAKIVSPLVVYQGGGMSAHAAKEIPSLLRAVRIRRLYGNQRSLAWLDSLFVLTIKIRRALSSWRPRAPSKSR